LREVVALLLADYGLDPTRGGMLGSLISHVEARLARLQIGEARFVERLRSDSEERQRLIHVITVRHSWFYRDPGQLDGLLQRMRTRHAQSPSRPLDVWIAGCAVGEEAWTIAMLAADAGIALRLRASDVDAVAVKLAQIGDYGAWSLRELPERLRRFVEPSGAGRWRITDELRAHDIEFAQHNLCDAPLPGQFDVICCRNVLIYFVAARAQAVVEGLRATLRPDGELMLGAGDLLFQTDGRVRPTTPTTTRPRPRTAAPRRTPAPQPLEAVAPEVVSLEVAELDVSSSSSGSAGLGVGSGALSSAGRAVEAGDHEAALEQLAIVLDADPLDAEAHLWTGIAQYSLGRDQFAAEALRRARCLAPQLWPATLFAALTNERRGLWPAATRCWAELERSISASDAPLIEGTAVLLDALPHWRAEALALARQRISKHADGRSHD
jgi:chemotaxis protein methyltransferase CheR